MNICEHLTATARLFPHRTAILFEGRSITYSQLNELSHTASQQLRAAGVGQGDRVAILLGNVPAFAVWYYAALRIGGIAVSMSTRAAEAEVSFLLSDCGAKVMVCHDGKGREFQDESLASLNSVIETNDAGEVALAGGESPSTSIADETWIDADPDDPALILYTSGTTGFPKGATLSHGNVRSNVCAFNHLCDMRPVDHILLAVPLFHCFGQNALLNSAFNVGATVVLQRRFDLNETKQLIADHSVTQLYGVPVMFQLLLGSCEPDDLNSVDYCFSAAAKMPVSVAESWREKFQMPINEGYGLTETSPFASYNHRLEFVPGSIGTPIDSVEMRILDTETGKTCVPGELGEIAIRGPNVMLGYWNREEETRAVLDKGWFRSGDIGRVDERGFFYIVDRVKDMIAVGGLKVFPAEVERVMLEHPGVSEVAVVGIPDDVFGEQVVAFVVLNSAEATAPLLSEIKDFTAARLANYKVPRVVTRVDELPRNPSGKVLKRELRDRGLSDVADSNNVEQATPQSQLRPPSLRQKLSESYESNYQQAVNVFVQELIQQLLGTDEPPAPEERFLEIGLDSLMIVEVSNQIQVELGPNANVPATLLFDYPRILDLSEFLLKALLSKEESGSPTKAVKSTTPNLRADVEALSEDAALEELMKELES